MVAKINSNSCAGCGSCIGRCPERAISLNDNEISFVDEVKCNDCSVCLDTCPHGAITVEYCSKK